MAGKNQCEWYDFIDGKPSKLHKDLIKTENRPTGNLLYAIYKTSDMAEKMDAVKDSNGNPIYKRNNQGQHNASDVLKFMDWNSFNKEGTVEAEKAAGAKDDKGIINYTDPEEALLKAKEFNDTRKRKVANVYKHGDVYNIVVSDKNSRTFKQPDEVNEKLELWNFYKQVFSANNIDISSAPQEIKSRFSSFNDKLFETLQNIKRTEFKYMLKPDFLTIFFLNANSAPVERLVQSFGSIENAAQAAYDLNRGVANITEPQKVLLGRAVEYGKNFPSFDLDAMQQKSSEIRTTLKSQSPSEAIADELHKLNKKFHIDFNETHRLSKEIHSISDAAAEAVLTIERQIRQIEKQEGNNEEGRRLSLIKRDLLKELANKKYYSGIISFFEEASQQLNFDFSTGTSIIDTILAEAGEATGTDLEKTLTMIKALSRIQNIFTMYYPLVEALADKNITIDESIDQEDIDNIRNTAIALKNLFDKQKKKIGELTFDSMEKLLVETMGNTTPDGLSIHNAVRMAAVDSSIFDKLYSIGRVSNPIVNTIGSIIRNAQNKRDDLMNDWALRTRRITDKLYKSGSTSEFMYEDEGHIASPYDWRAYGEAKREYWRTIKKQAHDDWELKQLMENWEKNHTEEIVVDKKNGRTERVPSFEFRKANDFQEGWTDVQKEYYDVMMQIKGEIGTLLPAYAQHQFLPPQVRRSTLDAIGHSKSIWDVLKALKNKLKDIFVIREDDPNFAEKGIVVDGQEKTVVETDFDNTKLRQIPIFYINRVEKGELLTDFSGALSHLAGTAVNYNNMDEIADVVEFIGDFAKAQTPRSNKEEVDVVGNMFYKVIADVEKKSRNTNTESIVNNFIAQHIYGERLDPEQPFYKIAKPILSLIGYTSFKGLATNVIGMVSNYLVGELQMLIEATGGEFYGLSNLKNAHIKLFGGAGVSGEISELLTNNMNHRATLFREKFDPLNENFSDKSNTRYYKSMFRQLVGHDCSFIGYASGEYLIHYVNMYAVLDNQKVFLDGKEISLFDAYEVVNKENGNSELKIKNGVTKGKKENGKWIDTGEAIDKEFENTIRKRIRYCNQSCHGSMNTEDKGIIHQKLMGRAVMNFRQWMVEHYSRRFRKLHFDESLGEMREGYWISYWHSILSEDTKEAWKDKKKLDAVGQFIKDFYTFTFRAQSQWSNLNEMERHNVNRVRGEMLMYICLLGLSFALGAPEDHKKEWWRRFWIYQTKRILTEIEASAPGPKSISSGLTIVQSPVPSVNTANALLYIIQGIYNGDVTDTIKSGPHKGKNRYLRNVKKYTLPVFKDVERLWNLGEDETIFQVFKDTPSNR